MSKILNVVPYATANLPVSVDNTIETLIERFARDQAGSGLKQLAQKALIGLRAVAHFGFKDDAIFHKQHTARLGNDGFVGVEFYFNDLNIFANDFVVDLV